MRLSKPIEIQGVSQALAKGNCPACAFLRNFQSALLRGDLARVSGTCNFHAWALAAVVNVANAAKVLQTLLRLGCDGSQECPFCLRLREVEQKQLKELVGQMERHLVLDSFSHNGPLCRPHSKRLRQIAPVRLHSAIDDIDRRISSELNSELDNPITRSAAGEKTGAGVLGRAAEFLMSQRGING